MSETGTVLAIGAHPDDMEFLCAGTLALLRKHALDVHIATMTPGDCGSMELSPEKISEIRRVEAREAAEVIGAAYTCLEEKDIHIEHGNAARHKIVELIRKVRPDIVFTHSPEDYMTDHEATSRNVRDAVFAAPIPNYLTGYRDPAPALSGVPCLFYCDALEGVNIFGERIAPHFYVDIRDGIDAKRTMLERHASQRDWLRAQHKVDHYILTMEKWSSDRGREIGVPYAEAFRQHRGHGYPKENRLAAFIEIFGEKHAS